MIQYFHQGWFWVGRGYGDFVRSSPLPNPKPPMTPEERKEMEHLIGFLDHFIFNVFYVVAEYPTANRTHY